MPANGEDDTATLRHGDGVAEESESADRLATEATTEATNRSSKSIDDGLQLGNLDKIKKGNGPPPGWWAWFRGTVLTIRDVDVLSARREATRNTCTFLVGLFACWLAVTVVAVVHSGFEYTPLFFLSIAEYDAGEIDLHVTAATTTTTTTGPWTRHRFLNFSRFMEEIGSKDEYLSYAAPRIEQPASLWANSACEGKLNVSDVRQRYDGPGEGEPCAGAANLAGESCMARFCGPPTSTWLVLHDHALEERMGLGRHWPHGPVGPGEVMVQAQVAKSLGVTEGQQLTVMIQLESFVRAAASADTVAGFEAGGGALHSAFYLPLTLTKVLNSTHGKLAAEEASAAFVDLRSLLASLSRHASPHAAAVSADLRRVEGLHFAESVNFNLPRPRLKAYMKNDFQAVKSAVLVFAARVVAALGPENVQAQVLLLGALKDLRVLSLFLALITSVIMAGLSGLLCLLIYSLLIVSVETRTFDLGVLRMVGLGRGGVVRLLVVQCLCYALPAWGLGLAAASYLSAAALTYLATVVGAVISPALPLSSVLFASAMGLLVPLLSAVLPIRLALSATLSDALDVNRNKVQAVQVTIERAGARALPLPLLAAGSISAGLGTVVYYLFPRALLEFNLTLLLYIFFALLVAIIAGLTMLALNLERPVEHLLSALLLWWNPAAVRAVMHKNLTAHRNRNRKTTIMYALSLAFIIFVIKTFDLQVATFGVQEEQRLGAPLILRCDRRVPSLPLFQGVDRLVASHTGVHPSHTGADAAQLEAAAEEEGKRMLADAGLERGLVLDYAVVTHALADIRGHHSHLSTLGNVYKARANVVGVSPHLASVVLPGLSAIRQRSPPPHPFQVTEELYTAAGSQGVGVGSAYVESAGLKVNRSCLLQTGARGSGAGWAWEVAPLALLDALAGLRFSPYPGAGVQDALVSLPAFVRLSDGAVKSMAEVPVHRVLFKVRSDATEEELDLLRAQLRKLADSVGCEVKSVWDRTKGLKVAVSAMDFFAGGTTGLALLISFFSLVSSMVTNIHEQAKEMGVLRALGLKQAWLRRIYTLEALVLVLSAGALGVAIGSLVAYTISAQRSLITQLPLPFTFPLIPTLVLAATSLLSALGAAYLPALRLARTNIVKLMRHT